MKPRDRILMALNHEEPDRCPMFVGLTPEFAACLEKDLDLDLGADAFHNPRGTGNTFRLDRALGNDMLLTHVGWANSYYQAGAEYTDEWGVGWRSVPYSTLNGIGRYTEMVHHPLADDNAVASYQPPDPHRPALYEDAEYAVRAFKDDYWIVGGTVTTIFEAAWGLRGYERLLQDFALNPELAEQVLDFPFHYHLEAAKKLVEMGVDMIWLGDDMGAQNAMLISPAMWRRFFKPRMAEFIARLKSINPRVKVAYHSDGQIYPVIPDLIEIGLDVLNPVQPRSMDPARLKKEFGQNLCFWGSIDEQHTLPFGTPAEVRGEVVERLKTLGKDGGLILGPTHLIQLDTPMENFWAMVDAIQGTTYASLQLH